MLRLSGHDVKTCLSILAARNARVMPELPPNGGRGECRVPVAPAASRVEKTRELVTTDTPVHPAFPHAMVLTVSFALSSVIGLCCHRRSRTRSTSLTPASRRQDHTTSPSASQRPRQSAARVHRIPPRVHDDRDTPLQWDETARDIELIWVWPKATFRKFRKNHAHRPTLGVDKPAASP
jgi:hypothetical protein